jgi:hypothetical protein
MDGDELMQRLGLALRALDSQLDHRNAPPAGANTLDSDLLATFGLERPPQAGYGPGSGC